MGIMEVFSPPRVALRAKEYGFVSDDSYDLTDGWDARDPNALGSLFRDIEEKDFYVVIMSPPYGKLPLYKLSPRWI